MRYPAAQFAEDTGVPQDTAERLLSALYENSLDVCDLNAVLWRLKDFVTKKNMPAMLAKASNADIKELVSQFVAEKKMYMMRVPQEVCCAETVDDLIAAFSDGVMPESAWFFSSIVKENKTYKLGDVVTIQILRAGEWNHDSYGKVKIDKNVIKDVVTNFKENKRGIDLAVDENHEENHKALGWFREVYAEDENTKCFAKIELTQKGADLLNEGAYKYFSPEISFRKVDEETGKPQRNLLLGGAFTNRPFFKGMQPLMANESAATGKKTSTDRAIDGQAYFFSQTATMHKLMLLMDKLIPQETISASEKSELELRFNELSDSDKVTTKTAVDELLTKFSEEEAKPEVEAPAAESTETTETETEEEAEVVADETATVEGIKANEDGTFAITDQAVFAETMKVIKQQQVQLAKQTRDLRFNEVKKSVKNLVFNDKTNKGFLLPKNTLKFAEFAMSLPEAKAKEFFELLKGIQPAEITKKFAESGHSKDVPKGNVEKPETFSDADEKVQFFMETLGQTLEVAKKSAADYYKSNPEQL